MVLLDMFSLRRIVASIRNFIQRVLNIIAALEWEASRLETGAGRIPRLPLDD